MNHRLACIVIIFSGLIPGISVQADVTADRMFSDHMVLQRDMAVPVWGTADSGEKVAVSFKGQAKHTVADEKGHWILRLDPLQVGEPGELSVRGGEKDIVFKDVLVGEVWVGSGQSNMAGGAGGYAKNDPVLAQWISEGPYPDLRLYKGGWKIANPQDINGFSALHFSFGISLHKALGVPVGLMVGAVGGTPSGRWLSEDMAMADKTLVSKMSAEEDAQKAGESEALKKWEIAVQEAKAAGRKAPGKPNPKIQIGSLYEQHIRPFVPYGIRGVLWDQGESRTQLPGVDQYTAMNALINGWRGVWGQGDFPFLHVQKPSGGGCAWDPDNPVNLRAAHFSKLPNDHVSKPQALEYPLHHIKIATLKNAPIVTASDLAPGIHPPTKSSYGQRACRVALGSVYGQNLAICGPVYKAHSIKGDTIRVTFDHVGQGLAFKHGEALQGFEVAGADGPWSWATATIEGDSVVVRSEAVPQPVHVQYAFSMKPSFANLFNKDGLPALMFTTVPMEP